MNVVILFHWFALLEKNRVHLLCFSRTPFEPCNSMSFPSDIASSPFFFWSRRELSHLTHNYRIHYFSSCFNIFFMNFRWMYRSLIHMGAWNNSRARQSSGKKGCIEMQLIWWLTVRLRNFVLQIAAHIFSFPCFGNLLQTFEHFCVYHNRNVFKNIWKALEFLVLSWRWFNSNIPFFTRKRKK